MTVHSFFHLAQLTVGVILVFTNYRTEEKRYINIGKVASSGIVLMILWLLFSIISAIQFIREVG